MNFAPIAGLRMLAVETGLLIAFTILTCVLLKFYRPHLSGVRWLDAILTKNWLPVVLVVAVALIGRAVVMPWIGIPQPRINDEFSYLLMGDTFAHFRLTNPTPQAWQHFETFHVNLVPTYHSKYPVAQGLALAVGEVAFRQPWIGIYLTTALLCGAICWTLQAFVPPVWALVGGLLATVRIALFSYWMNSYWGGSMAALGGALALGSVVRLFDTGQPARNRTLLASVFATSLLLLATSRPYEGLAFSIPLLVYFAYKLTTGLSRQEVTLRSTALPIVVVGVAGLLMMGYYNWRTTGDALLLPHLLNERTYSPLPLFVWQRPKSHLTFHDPVFANFFAITENEYKYEQTKAISGLLSIEGGRLLGDWFFYVGVALSFPALIGFLASMNDPRMRIAVAAALSTVVALVLCIYSMPHYAAPATVTVYIFATEGLWYLWQQGKRGEQVVVVALCLTVVVSSLARQTGSAALNSKYDFPNTRRVVTGQLENQPGNHLVLVSYDMQHHYPGDELVHNGADFATEKVIWARSKGTADDLDLCRAYPDRTFWSLTTDDLQFSLHPLQLCGTQRLYVIESASQGSK